MPGAQPPYLHDASNKLSRRLPPPSHLLSKGFHPASRCPAAQHLRGLTARTPSSSTAHRLTLAANAYTTRPPTPSASARASTSSSNQQLAPSPGPLHSSTLLHVLGLCFRLLLLCDLPRVSL